jgi:hypothetical protein
MGQTNSAELNFRKDISYLASDELGGRLSGSTGEKLSAAYISEAFKNAGLKLLRDTGTQNFDIIQLRLAKNQCSFKMYFGDEHGDFTQHFTLFEEFYPLSESSNSDSVAGDLVHVGYGISAPSAGLNEYQNLKDLKGKIFVIKMGFAGDDTAPHSSLAAFSSITSKITTAIENGAAGIIFIPGSSAGGIPPAELQRNGQTFPIPIIYFKKIIPAEIRMQAKINTSIAALKTSATNVYAFKNNHKKTMNTKTAHYQAHKPFTMALMTTLVEWLQCCN